MWFLSVNFADFNPLVEKAMAPQYSCLENPMDGGAW